MQAVVPDSIFFTSKTRDLIVQTWQLGSHFDGQEARGGFSGGERMTVSFLRLSAPKMTEMRCVVSNKIDLNYMVCGRLFLALCQHYTRWGGLRDHQYEQDSSCTNAHFVFPHVLASSSMTGQFDWQCWKRSNQSRGIDPAQATHLWDPEAAADELGGNTIICLCCLRDWRSSAKTVLILSSTSVPRCQGCFSLIRLTWNDDVMSERGR